MDEKRIERAVTEWTRLQKIVRNPAKYLGCLHILRDLRDARQYLKQLDEPTELQKDLYIQMVQIFDAMN